MPESQKQLPELNTALRELFRRQIRQVVWLFVRMVLLSMLMATFQRVWPSAEGVISAIAGILAIGPFVLGIAQNWQWRIALGKSYLAAGRTADAIVVLKPLDGVQGRLFDPTDAGKAALTEARKTE